MSDINKKKPKKKEKRIKKKEVNKFNNLFTS